MTDFARVLVAGIGRRHYGDDAVGPLVADILSKRSSGNVRVIADAGDGWRVLEETADADLLVLVDAAQAQARMPVGRWRRLDASNGFPPIEPRPGRGTHRLGLDELASMGRRLGRLPPTVWVYVVAGRAFVPETPPSPAVSRILERVADRIEKDIAAFCSIPARKGLQSTQPAAGQNA